MSVMIDAPPNPQTITVDNGLCTSEPNPWAREAGNNPRMATKEAITIGLKQAIAP